MNKRLLIMIFLMLFASQAAYAGLGGPSNKHRDNYSSISKQKQSKSLGTKSTKSKKSKSKKRKLKGKKR